jgi:hypothetical protein
VVSSLGDIRKFSRSFLKRLRQRQHAQQPFVESIGDVILAAVLEWGPAYVTYAADHPLGELEIERQIDQNLLFAEHISVSSTVAPTCFKCLTLLGPGSLSALTS